MAETESSEQAEEAILLKTVEKSSKRCRQSTVITQLNSTHSLDDSLTQIWMFKLAFTPQNRPP